MPKVRKPTLVLTVFLVLLGIWQWQLLKSLFQPQLVQAGIVAPSEPSTGDEPHFLYPDLGISTPVTEAAWTSPLQTQDWRAIREALTRGVSLAYEGDSFSNVTLAFLTGHSSDLTTHKFSSVFAPLGQAKLGQEFQLQLSHGQYRYRVVDKQRLNPSQTESFQSLDTGEFPRVVLVTCWPPLTTAQRLVVIGERIDS